jgi:uncharacterized phiE125 gp8 family phage protein
MTGTLAKILAPTSWPLSQADARAFVVIDDEDADHLRVLDMAIRAATQYCETRSGLTAQRTTYQLRLDHWPHCDPRRFDHGDTSADILLTAAPVRDVLSVTYVDPDGIEQTVSDADWTWERTPEGATVSLAAGFSRPTLRSNRKGVVRVLFDAGFDTPGESGSGDDPELQLPEQFIMAVAQLVGHFYEKRDAGGDDMKAADCLIDQVKVYR